MDCKNKVELTMKWLLACGVVVLLAFSGCSSAPAQGQVKGKVTVAGKGPLTGGTIYFVSTSDSKLTGSGPIKSDGSYDVGNAPVGQCKVTISNESLKNAPGVAIPTAAGPGSSKMGGPPSGLSIPGEMGTMDSPKYMPIDPAFSKAESTTLSATIKKGSNSLDFEVK